MRRKEKIKAVLDYLETNKIEGLPPYALKGLIKAQTDSQWKYLSYLWFVFVLEFALFVYAWLYDSTFLKFETAFFMGVFGYFIIKVVPKERAREDLLDFYYKLIQEDTDPIVIVLGLHYASQQIPTDSIV